MLLVSELLEHVHIVIQILSFAEELVHPQHPARPQHPIPIEQDEVEELEIDPPIKEHAGVDQIHGVVKEWEPLAERGVERNQSSQCNHLTEWRTHVQSGRDYGHIPLPHPRSKAPRSDTDVEPDPDLPGLHREHIADEEVHERGIRDPPQLLPLQFEAPGAPGEAPHRVFAR